MKEADLGGWPTGTLHRRGKTGNAMTRSGRDKSPAPHRSRRSGQTSTLSYLPSVSPSQAYKEQIELGQAKLWDGEYGVGTWRPLSQIPERWLHRRDVHGRDQSTVIKCRAPCPSILLLTPCASERGVWPSLSCPPLLLFQHHIPYPALPCPATGPCTPRHSATWIHGHRQGGRSVSTGDAKCQPWIRRNRPRGANAGGAPWTKLAEAGGIYRYHTQPGARPSHARPREAEVTWVKVSELVCDTIRSEVA